MKYTRIFADLDGETHFDDMEDEYQQIELAPTAKMGVAKNKQASNARLAYLPPGYFDDFHPAPMRYLVAYLRGHVEITVTDGEVRTFGPGDISLQWDVDSKGHRNRVLGQSNCEFLLVELTA